MGNSNRSWPHAASQLDLVSGAIERLSAADLKSREAAWRLSRLSAAMKARVPVTESTSEVRNATPECTPG